MNRSQRQYGRWCQKRLRDKFDMRTKADGIEEILPPKTKPIEQKTQTINTKKQNRSCFTDINQENIQKIKSFINATTEKYPQTNLLQDQYGFDPALPENIVKDIQKVLGPPLKAPATIIVPMKRCESLKQDKYSQYSADNFRASAYVGTSDTSLMRWRPLEKAEDVDLVLKEEQKAFSVYSTTKIEKPSPKKVKISEEPKLKVIAKVFSKFTKNVIELRKLEEKIVCVEYEVTDDEDKLEKPLQKLRAFFRIKPIQKNQDFDKDNDLYFIPTIIKETYDINDEDLPKLREREIEIIDESKLENQPYLEDLKRLLQRNNEFHSQKTKNKVDLKSLYEMAQRDSPIFDTDSKSNLFSATAMKEMKELILNNCVSTAQGMNRKTIKNNLLDQTEHNTLTSGSVSKIVNELLRGIQTH